MKNKRSKPLLTAILAGCIIGSGIGCDINKTQISKEKERLELIERSGDSLEKKMDQITVYQRYGEGEWGINYKEFKDITGIPNKLGVKADDLTVWVEVGGEYDSIKQKILNKRKDNKGYITIKIPYEKAESTYLKLAKYKNEKLKELKEEKQND